MATASDLDTFLGLGGTVDTARATALIGYAEVLAESVVNPLPAGSDVIILGVAARAYSNPSGVTSETVGPYSVQRPWPSLFLTKAEKRTLRRMAGVPSGAFTIDPTATDAMTDYVDALESPDIGDAEQWAEDYPLEG